VVRHYDDYLPESPDEIEAWGRSQAPVTGRAGRLLSACVPAGGKVLDVGCGFGFLLAELKGRGFESEGLEISPTGLRHSRSKGVKVHEGILDAGRFPEKSFDAVCAFYVIEHLESPRSFLREARRILGPGGVLLMRWPNTAPLVRWCRLLSVRVDLYDAPSHLVDFTPASMGWLLRRSGFERVKTWPGGSTRPDGWVPRIAGMVGGFAGDALFSLSGGRVILPGPSKTTLAFRPRN
jgi:SAM-dependent methyltransferase